MEQQCKITLVGRVGNIRTRQVSEMYVYRIPVAVEKVYRDKGANIIVETNWFNVVYWTEKPMTLTVGCGVRVEGTVRQTRYMREDGSEAINFEIKADKVELVKID